MSHSQPLPLAPADPGRERVTRTPPHPGSPWSQPPGPTCSAWDSPASFRELPTARSAGERALPDRVADEEGSEALEILRGLRGLAHSLHEMRQGMKLAADEADDEVVVVDRKRTRLNYSHL